MISNFEIRKRARDVLGKDLFKGSWLYPVLIVLIVTAISGALSSTYVGPIIVTGLLSVATARYFTLRVRGHIEPGNIEASIDVLKNNFTGSLVVGVLVSLFVSIGTVLFVIPGIIFAFSFAMTFYVLNDHPEMRPMDALRESRRLMRGHKMQYFFLNLSFIGWLLLGALCLGVGSLWASAYMETANAVFYEELLAADQGYVNATAAENHDNDTSW